MKNNQNCKICGKSSLKIIYHIAICKSCGVHLFYPYPDDDETILNNKKYSKDNIAVSDNKKETQRRQLEYLLKSGDLNISNFKRMINYTIDESKKNEKIKILDYGGGSGQFASICKMILPDSEIYIRLIELIDCVTIFLLTKRNLVIPTIFSAILLYFLN